MCARIRTRASRTIEGRSEGAFHGLERRRRRREQRDHRRDVAVDEGLGRGRAGF